MEVGVQRAGGDLLVFENDCERIVVDVFDVALKRETRERESERGITVVNTRDHSIKQKNQNTEKRRGDLKKKERRGRFFVCLRHHAV